jgi:hypothetical protein
VPGSVEGGDTCEEAAALYAAGRTQDAANVLTNQMQAMRGQVDKRLWYMLFDLYQSTDQHAPFERLAVLFAQAFQASPPAWEQWGSAPLATMGRNVLVIEGFPSGINRDKSQDFIAASRQANEARLDLSRTRLEEVASEANGSIEKLHQLMTRLRRYRVPTLLMGETRLLDELRAVIARPGDARGGWLLMFEILQWRGEEEAFDDLAIEYAIRFEQSAPGYETSGAIALNPDDTPSEDADAGANDAASFVVVPEKIESANVDRLLGILDKRLRRFGSARLDFSRVKLLSFDAASTLASFLSSLGVARGRVIISKPTELVISALDMSGAISYVSVEARKR